MKNPPALIATMRAAYEIFADELRGHLEFFNDLAGRLQAADEQVIADEFAASAKALENRFHLIKGGSGFLQLAEIAELSKTGEEWFKGAALHRGDLLQLRDDYLALVKTLAGEADELQQQLQS